MLSAGENGHYGSISDECMRYYYDMHNKSETIFGKKNKGRPYIRIKLIRKNEVFINNLNLKLRTLDAKSMRDDKEMLKTMHEVFCGIIRHGLCR